MNIGNFNFSTSFNKGHNTKLNIIASLIFLSSFSSCESDNKNTNTETANSKELTKETNDETEDIDISYSKDELVIIGSDIWIKNKPISGDVIMKLNTGDVCKIFETGEKDQIRDMFDYWYKIEFKDTVGWVFGSQTNIKLQEVHDIIPFKNYLIEFIEAYQDKNNDLNKFAHDEIPKTFLFNPGAFCAEYYSNDLNRELRGSINSEDIFNKKPKGDFCEGYSGEKNGFYFWSVKSTELPVFADPTGEEFKTETLTLPDKYTNNTIYKVQIIINEYHFSYLYFINIDTTWYLFCENRCDCSA